jgi:hypothetical protein
MKRVLVSFLLVVSSALLLGQSQSSFVQPTNPANAQVSERLSSDTPETTVLGNAFIAPRNWSVRAKGPATILEAPEGDSWVALVDVQAKTPEEALAAAWQEYRPDAKWPVFGSSELKGTTIWEDRVCLADRKIQPITDMTASGNLVIDIGSLGWTGLAPDGSILALRDIGTQEIYALDVKWP